MPYVHIYDIMEGKYYRLYQSDLVIIFDSKWPSTHDHLNTYFALIFTHMMVKVKHLAASLFFVISTIAMLDM